MIFLLILTKYTVTPGTIDEIQNYQSDVLPVQDNTSESNISSAISMLSDSESFFHNVDSENASNCNDDYSLNESSLGEDLAKWILTYNISRSASNDLFKVLHKHGHNDLPKCTRTILQEM